MPTINDLMKGKQPGEIKVRLLGWNQNEWFKPYFKDECWHGTNQIGKHHNYTGAGDWQLWQEPVEEVEVFEWMYRHPNQHNWYVFATLMTERDAQGYFIKRFQYRKTGRSWRLPK